MDEALIYRKTKRGAAELTATHGALSSPARRVLILLDGQRTLAELAELFGAESVEHIVAELEAQGFVRQVDPDNALTTQAFPTIVAEPRLAPLEPPPSRRGSTWIALSLLVAACATAGGGYWFFLRPNHASEPIFASAGTTDIGRSIPAPAPDDRNAADAPAARELPLSGLPALTVTPARKVAAEPGTGAEVVPAAAVVPVSEPAAPGRRQAERAVGDHTTTEHTAPAAPTTVLAAAKAALETTAPTDVGTAAASAALQTLSARTAPAQPTPPAPAPTDGSQPAAAGSASTAGGPGSQPAPSPAVASVGPPPAGSAPAASKPAPAPLGEQVASLAPPPRPASSPIQLHQRRHDPPEFPVRAVRAKVFEGHVLARIWVTADGNVDQVDIVKATPPRIFDEEVKRALNTWTFDPPGRPVDTTIELDFKP